MLKAKLSDNHASVTMELDAKLIGQAHVIDILSALEEAGDEGRTHGYIHYEVVKSPDVNNKLKKMEQVGWIDRKKGLGYVITKRGKAALDAGRLLLNLSR